MKLHEIQFVSRLRQLAARAALRAGSGKQRGASGLALATGIGDDCAVIRHNSTHDLLVTTDLFIEEVHFRRAWQPAASVGKKVLTRGLSDIAAMGGAPRLAFLSLALPHGTKQRWIDDFLRGFFALARRHGVALAGGDTGSSPAGFLADIIVLGEVPRGQAVLRSTARAGDEVWVSGKLGGAALALSNLRAGKLTKASNRALRPYFHPQARLRIGEYLRERKLATAMMDLSDGLSIDLTRLCQSSGVGGVVESSAIPRARATPLDCALDGGDDFELLFTVPARKSHLLPPAVDGVALTRIGRLTRRRELLLAGAGRVRPLPVRGYQHF